MSPGLACPSHLQSCESARATQTMASALMSFIIHFLLAPFANRLSSQPVSRWPIAAAELHVFAGKASLATRTRRGSARLGCDNKAWHRERGRLDEGCQTPAQGRPAAQAERSSPRAAPSWSG